jgi:hypothetical protein
MICTGNSIRYEEESKKYFDALMLQDISRSPLELAQWETLFSTTFCAAVDSHNYQLLIEIPDTARCISIRWLICIAYRIRYEEECDN